MLIFFARETALGGLILVILLGLHLQELDITALNKRPSLQMLKASRDSFYAKRNPF